LEIWKSGDRPGLCATCAHATVVRNDRGSTFYLCERSKTDPGFPRYPRLPVVSCVGYDRSMHTIQPARLRPGVSPSAIVDHSRDAAAAGDHRLIRGKALIFWDRKSPVPKKLDAIDTDQITPAADCVSESLETLDERWKAGSFRYLMPDFRARVHRGETFVIAGDRFAIGSSREMSPAGLKGVAEEVGRHLVVVCGHNMG